MTLKNREKISNSVDKELMKRLRAVSSRTLIPISKLLDRGIQLVLNEYEEKK